MRVGIDLGTTNSGISWYNPASQKIEIVKIDGDERIPSVVYWAQEASERKFGKRAVLLAKEGESLSDVDRRAYANSDYFAVSFKSDFANRANHVQSLDTPFNVRPDRVVTAYLAWLLESFRKISGVPEGTQIAATLTHPATEAWSRTGDNSPVDRLKWCAEEAGFVDIKMELEPIAAFREVERRDIGLGDGVLVFDLGGGTLDLVYFQRAPDGKWGRPFVSGTGVSGVAGDSYDAIVNDMLEKKIGEQCRDVTMEGRLIGAARLSREVKETLSAKDETTTSMLIRNSQGQSNRVVAEIRREVFEDEAGHIFLKLEKTLEGYVKEIKSKGGAIDTVLLVGGSTNIPKVKEIVKKIVGIDGLRIPDADFLVALGALDGSDIEYTASEVESAELEEFNTLMGNGQWGRAKRIAEILSKSHDCRAQHLLGKFYEKSPWPDLIAAYDYYKAAAEGGSAEACLRIGELCRWESWFWRETNGAVEESPERAFAFFRKGAELGNPQAMYEFGVCLSDGYGCSHTDKVLALSWLKRAAELGNDDAIGELKEFKGGENE